MGRGAQPALRGYRLQVLYTLHYLLTRPPIESEQVVPEGIEDLSVMQNGAPIAVIQVKAHTDALALSDLRPEKADSFLYRVFRTIEQNPATVVKLVTFGRVGRELSSALTDGGSTLTRLAEKIRAYGFLTSSQASSVLARIDLVEVQEDGLRTAVLDVLKSTMVVGDYPAAYDMLQKWVTDCAETAQPITRADVVRVFTNIGRFVTHRAEHHREWFSSILPVSDTQIDSVRGTDLSGEFYSGVAARYEHILANLDVPRPSMLERLREAFGKSRVVVLHGASGQGKSTLAYRFLKESFPEYLRLQVSTIDGTSHALRIAAVIREQAEALDLPFCVFVDVAPGSQGWSDLVKQLSRLSNVWTLVAIREEDLRRADLPKHEAGWEGVAIELNQNEAQELFSAFRNGASFKGFLSFDEAWERFGGSGPLLEFVHLLTQGDSLISRLSQQVSILRDAVRLGTMTAAELSLLRLVSVAGMAGAHLHIDRLAHHLSLPEPKRTLDLLEKEYLVRVNVADRTVDGLHPIRSRLLASLLTEANPTSLEEAAAECLPLCTETTIGPFLFVVFSEAWKFDSLTERLRAFVPRSWTGMAGCVSGLLWYGLRRYVAENLPLCRTLFDRCGSGWSAVVDFDLTDAVPGSADSLLDTVCTMVGPAGAAEIRELRGRQTHKSRVFRPCQEWLKARSELPDPPSVEREWEALALVAFWDKRLGKSDAVSRYCSQLDMGENVANLPLEVNLDLCLGLYGYGNPHWEGYRNTVMRMFLDQHHIHRVEDDGKTVRIHFVVDPHGSKNPHQQTMDRVQQLPKLWPDRSVYASQGYGSHLGGPAPDYDETSKEIQARNLPHEWLTSVNAAFQALVDLSFRPADWGEYLKQVMSFRIEVLDLVDEVTQFLQRYFCSRTFLSATPLLNSARWKNGTSRLLRPLLLPATAYRPMASFGSDRSTEERYRRLLEAERKFTSGLSNFFTQARDVLQLHPLLGRAANPANRSSILKAAAEGYNLNPRFAFLSTHNLTDAVSWLPRFQREIRNTLGPLEGKDSAEIEQREFTALRALWHLWFFFVVRPEALWKDPERKSVSEAVASQKTLLERIDKAMGKLDCEGYLVRRLGVVSWDDQPVIWISVDTEDPVKAYTAAVPTLTELRALLFSEDEMLQLMRRASWSDVAIVPLVRGRSLMRQAWRLPLAVLQKTNPADPLGEWNYVLYDIPSDAWSQLGLCAHELPQVDQPKEFLQAYRELLTHAEYIEEITRASELDEGNTVSRVAQDGSVRLFTAAFHTLEMLLPIIDRIAHAEESSDDVKSLLGTAAGLVKAFSEPFRCAQWLQDRVLPPLAELSEWCKALQELQGVTAQLYIAWICILYAVADVQLDA